MLRLTCRRFIYDRLGKTKLGAEVLSKTRSEMKSLEQESNFLIRFFTRRRPIDFLAIEVDNRIARELHPSFYYAKALITVLLMGPIFVWLFSGKMEPSYYALVPTRILTRDRYEKIWEFSDWYMVLGGQVIVAIILYDLSVYIRYPIFAYLLAPAYRKMGLVRSAPVGAMGAQELKSVRKKIQAAPLGKPLHEVKKDAKKRDNPFGSHKS
ncbi:hypothetical protein, conserved [Angomonas deanei]|uniref:Uncharacterized protein n=1 Tax=Angomonas deanei TaxID=59799 RepID=A0A7G2C176_9TRYP|nr:hypothetical protein, conserved [Angomonas deanei]